MHLKVVGSVQQYTIPVGTPLRSSIAGRAVEILGPPPGSVLLNPTAFVASPKPGMSSQNIQLTQVPFTSLGIDGVKGEHEVTGDYQLAPHVGSARYAKSGDILELSVANTTGAHHPLHLHGFSIQPMSLTKTGSPTYTWPYHEFRDNVDVPAGYTLNFRMRIDPRPLADGTTTGGECGRWLLHCHIFFHAVNGMIGELVVTGPDGNKKPTVNVGGTWAYVTQGNTAIRHGTWHDTEGDPVTLTATLGTGAPFGTVTKNADGTWDWSYSVPSGAPDSTDYVYITATDSNGHKDQVPFRLRIGGLDDGADNGDPHFTTTNGKHYDFQAVGEFTLLRDFDGVEIQARQAPVATAAPILDPYSGLTSCVSINTAVAAQLLDHRLSFEPVPGPPSKAEPRLVFFLDGKAADVSTRGLNLGPGARVIAYPLSGGARSYELDYPGSTVLTVTPWFWDAHQVWLLNVSISRTPAYLGVMGDILQKSWLPTLPTGSTVGPKPASLPARYVALYQKFANAWRVTKQTSLFVLRTRNFDRDLQRPEVAAQERPLQGQSQVRGRPQQAGRADDQSEEGRACVHAGHGQEAPQGLRVRCVRDGRSQGGQELSPVAGARAAGNDDQSRCQQRGGPSWHSSDFHRHRCPPRIEEATSDRDRHVSGRREESHQTDGAGQARPGESEADIQTWHAPSHGQLRPRSSPTKRRFLPAEHKPDPAPHSAEPKARVQRRRSSSAPQANGRTCFEGVRGSVLPVALRLCRLQPDASESRSLRRLTPGPGRRPPPQRTVHK
jgi:hypothetical protein